MRDLGGSPKDVLHPLQGGGDQIPRDQYANDTPLRASAGKIRQLLRITGMTRHEEIRIDVGQFMGKKALSGSAERLVLAWAKHDVIAGCISGSAQRLS